MGGRSWTELFFLDEATAFAAGHRPMLLLPPRRRQPVSQLLGEGQRCSRCLAREMDAVLHQGEAGVTAGSGCIRCRLSVLQLPDGAIVQASGESFLIVQGRALQWSMAGYHKVDGAIGLTRCC